MSAPVDARIGPDAWHAPHPAPRLTRATHPCPLVRDWRCAVPCTIDDCRDPRKDDPR